MNLDVSSVGNHEFDEGVTELLRMQKGGCLADGPDGVNGQNSCPGTQDFTGADFKYLGANVAWKNPAGHPRPTPFKPYQIFRVEDQKVAFIGMTLEGTPAIVSQAGIADVQFNDEIETANALVPKLRKKGVKSIIVLLHEGGVPTDATAYNGCVGVSGAGLAIAEGPLPADRRGRQWPHPPALQLHGQGPARPPAPVHERLVVRPAGHQAALEDRPEDP